MCCSHSCFVVELVAATVIFYGFVVVPFDISALAVAFVVVVEVADFIDVLIIIAVAVISGIAVSVVVAVKSLNFLLLLLLQLILFLLLLLRPDIRHNFSILTVIFPWLEFCFAFNRLTKITSRYSQV